jgi:putative tricarboxylic transport membrane protein
MRLRAVARTVLVVFAASAGTPFATAAQTLTLVAPAAPGGGWDQTARVLQRVLTETEPGASVQVDNIPGAAGTIGLARFVQAERGNPDALLLTGLVMVSGIITSQSQVRLDATAPIALLTGEFEIIVVPAASPYHSLGDLIAAFKQDPGAVSWGGGSAGGTDDLLVRLLAEQVGVAPSRANYIAFPGGGAALVALLGGEVTAGVSGYAEFAGQVEAGQLRVLALSSPSRVAGIDAPTIREAGVPLDLSNWRGVMAPPGLSDAERDQLTMRVTRAARSKAWQDALVQYGWQDLFLTGPQFRQFLLAEEARIEAVFGRLAETGSGPDARSSTAITPTTLPFGVAALFVIVALVMLATRRGAWAGRSIRAPMPALVLAGGLLAQPLLFPFAGFVASSTILFAAASSVLRGSRGGTIDTSRFVADAALGFAFSATLYIVFNRGLGVLLPPMPGLGGWL